MKLENSICISVNTINVKDLSLPLFLSYHSGGFKVMEESGKTGLGWTLNSGGTITQVVKGFDDFGPYKNRDNEFEAMYTDLHNDPNLNVEDCIPQLSWKIQKDNPGNSHPTGVSYYNYDPHKMSGIKDLEPDLFKFNFLNYSGGIVLDWKTETFKCLNNPNIKVISGGSNGFEIITPEGHTLIFDKVEETKIKYTYNAYQELVNLKNSSTLCVGV